MLSKFLISPTFIFGIFGIIFILHILALSFGWYFSVRNFDNIHHFLGGIFAGAVLFYFLSSRPNILNIRQSFWATVIFGVSFAALAGIAWEFFEFSFDEIFANQGIFPRGQLGLTDTMSDLFFDLLGGFVFTAVYFKSLKR